MAMASTPFSRYLPWVIVLQVVTLGALVYFTGDLVGWFHDSATDLTAGRKVLGPFDLAVNWTGILAIVAAVYSAGFLVYLRVLARMLGTDVRQRTGQSLRILAVSLLVAVVAYGISASLFNGV
jgi:hypothetical protein